jgi:hypothetical protein
MDRTEISGYIRQLRYKAKKNTIQVDLCIESIESVINEGKYCDICNKGRREALDTVFPYKECDLITSAHILVLCKVCKAKKGQSDLLKHFNCHEIDQARLVDILNRCFNRPGGKGFKTFVRRATGYE